MLCAVGVGVIAPCRRISSGDIIIYYGMRKLILIIFVFSALPLCAQNKSYHGDGIDDYLRFVPLVSTYALKVSGVESEHGHVVCPDGRSDVGAEIGCEGQAA